MTNMLLSNEVSISLPRPIHGTIEISCTSAIEGGADPIRIQGELVTSHRPQHHLYGLHRTESGYSSPIWCSAPPQVARVFLPPGEVATALRLRPEKISPNLTNITLLAAEPGLRSGAP